MNERVRDLIRRIFSLSGDVAEYNEIRQRMADGGKVTGTNMCILMLAIFVASIGLNMNSTAVIIGAMLISPLMGTIQTMAYGAATIDLRIVRNATIGFLCQVFVSVLSSTIYFLLSPISDATSELLARTQPNIWDVLIAICGGLAGMIGMTRKEKSNVLPGVAIATALMPPLCTCGYSIANGKWQMLLGAGYLFLVNSYFIMLSSVAILLLLKIPKKKNLEKKQWQHIKRILLRNTIILIIPSLVVALGMVKNSGKEQHLVTGFEQEVVTQEVAKQMEILFPEIERISIGKMETVKIGSDVVNERVVLVYGKKEITKDTQDKIEKWLEVLYQGDCKIILMNQ